MLEEQLNTIETEEKTKILEETAKVVWKQIELFYAKGVMISVSEELDLIQVAHNLSIDNTEKIDQWIKDGLLLRSFDEQASVWAKSEEAIWTVVVKPWVLVQGTRKTIN